MHVRLFIIGPYKLAVTKSLFHFLLHTWCGQDIAIECDTPH